MKKYPFILNGLCICFVFAYKIKIRAYSKAKF